MDGGIRAEIVGVTSCGQRCRARRIQMKGPQQKISRQIGGHNATKYDETQNCCDPAEHARSCPRRQRAFTSRLIPDLSNYSAVVNHCELYNDVHEKIEERLDLRPRQVAAASTLFD